MEVVQPAHEILSVQRESVVFQAAIERRHFVCDVSDDYAIAKNVRSENDCSVRETELRVFEAFAIWLALLFLLAVGEMGSLPGCEFFVILKVAEARTKFAGCGLPYQ